MKRSKEAPPLRKPDYGDTLKYMEQFKPGLMRCFAREVIRAGFGATCPNNIGTESEPRYETMQACGRRLFGDEFKRVLREELEKRMEGRKSA